MLLGDFSLVQDDSDMAFHGIPCQMVKCLEYQFWETSHQTETSDDLFCFPFEKTIFKICYLIDDLLLAKHYWKLDQSNFLKYDF